MRRGGAVVGAIAVLLALAGCSAIPTSSEVQAQRTTAGEDSQVVIVPPRPAAGAGPDEIVNGFIQAASAGSGFAVARQYLTPAFAKTWSPRGRILVHGSAPQAVTTQQDRLELRVPLTGVVDAAGTYRPSAATRSVPFRLERVAGQWRIAETDDGLVLSEGAFTQNYQPASLQFFDPAFKRFVPDVRWLARNASPLVLTRALVGGQSAPLLGGATASAFPSGSTVRSATTSSEGEVTVVLTTPGDPPTPQATERMQQQIASTLDQPTTAVVRLIVDGRQAPPARTLSSPSLASTAFVLAGGRFGSLSRSGTVAPDAELGAKIVAARPDAVTVSPRQHLAVLRTDRGAVLVDRTKATVLDDGPDLVPPTLDQDGWTYVATGDGSAPVVAYSSSRRKVELATGPIGAVRAIEASPDGTRMLVLRQNGSIPSAYVVGIERSADGTPTGFTEDRFAIPVDPSTTAVTWIDAKSIGVLSSDDAQSSVSQVQIAGLTSSLGSLGNTVSTIVGTTSATDLRALTSDTGDLYVRDANVWQLEFDDHVKASVLAVQR